MGHADTHRTMHGMFNDNNLDAMRDHLTDDATFNDVPAGQSASGKDDVLAWIQAWKTGFSDATIADAEYLDGEDHSVAFFQAQGTHDGEFGPFAATGNKLDAPFCEVLRFDGDGKVTGSRLYYDQATMMQQLGVTPPEASA